MRCAFPLDTTRPSLPPLPSLSLSCCKLFRCFEQGDSWGFAVVSRVRACWYVCGFFSFIFILPCLVQEWYLSFFLFPFSFPFFRFTFLSVLLYFLLQLCFGSNAVRFVFTPPPPSLPAPLCYNTSFVATMFKLMFMSP
eukprot:RCo035532